MGDPSFLYSLTIIFLPLIVHFSTCIIYSVNPNLEPPICLNTGSNLQGTETDWTGLNNKSKHCGRPTKRNHSILTYF